MNAQTTATPVNTPAEITMADATFPRRPAMRDVTTMMQSCTTPIQRAANQAFGKRSIGLGRTPESGPRGPIARPELEIDGNYVLRSEKELIGRLPEQLRYSDAGSAEDGETLVAVCSAHKLV